MTFAAQDFSLTLRYYSKSTTFGKPVPTSGFYLTIGSGNEGAADYPIDRQLVPVGLLADIVEAVAARTAAPGQSIDRAIRQAESVVKTLNARHRDRLRALKEGRASFDAEIAVLEDLL